MQTTSRLLSIPWGRIERNVPGRARHPAVVWMNEVMLAVTLLFWLYYATTRGISLETLGVHVFFVAQCNLYLCSAYFHTVPLTSRTRVLDQTSIGFFIIAAGIPALLYNDDATWLITLVMVATLVCYALSNLEMLLLQAPLFFGAGSLSVKNMHDAHGAQSQLFWLMMLLYILKLAIHCWNPKPVPGHIHGSEIGHLCALAPAIIINDFLVLQYY